MWSTGAVWDLLAAEPAPASGGSDQLIVMIGGVIVAAIGGLVTITVAMINSRANRTSPSPPSPDPSGDSRVWEAVRNLQEDFIFVRERVAVHGQRLDDHDDTNDIQDKRLDAIERAKDHDHPGWRRY